MGYRKFFNNRIDQRFGREILGLILYLILSKISNINEIKFYLMRFLKLFLNLNNTYVRNLAVRNLSGLNVFNCGLKKRKTKIYMRTLRVSKLQVIVKLVEIILVYHDCKSFG